MSARLVLLAWAAAWILLAALMPAAASGARQIDIEGRVWADEDGDGADPGAREPALPDVVVKLFRDGREIDETRTDEMGRYRFGGLETGAYKVAIEEATLPDELGLGPASFLARNYVEVTRPIAAADFGFVPHPVIEELMAAAAEPAAPGAPAGPPTEPGGADADRRSPAEGAEPVTPAGSPAGPIEEEVASEGRGLWLLAVLAALVLLVFAVRRLAAGPRAAAAAESRSGEPPSADPDKMIELFLGYRDAQAWSQMDSLYQAMPEPMRRMTVVRQQRAFALNRAGEHDAAERLLREQMADDGASPETCGMIGRVFKDRMEDAHAAGDAAGAAEMLAQAIDHYLLGHDADPSDPYPGINALTLMEWEASPRDRRDSLLGEVARAVEARTAAPEATYWDHATHLELSILRHDEAGAAAALAAAAAAPRTPWQVETTRRNLRLLREGRERKGEDVPGWARDAEGQLARPGEAAGR